MTRTAPAKANTVRRLRRACFMLLAVAMLFSGFGAGHAALALPAHGTHQIHAAAAKVPAASPDHQKCHDQKAVPDKSPSSTHDLGGCCVNACFPSAIPRDVLSFTPPAFESQQPRPSTDQAPVVRTPSGLFRPPRDRA
jgi:hypothetical protein